MTEGALIILASVNDDQQILTGTLGPGAVSAGLDDVFRIDVSGCRSALDFLDLFLEGRVLKLCGVDDLAVLGSGGFNDGHRAGGSLGFLVLAVEFADSGSRDA